MDNILIRKQELISALYELGSDVFPCVEISGDPRMRYIWGRYWFHWIQLDNYMKTISLGKFPNG